MEILKTVSTVQQLVTAAKSKGQTVGFVPTMGALHQGHLSLVEACRNRCDLVVCSIFVNPTQFNEATDFDKYPRTITADTQLLAEQGCDLLFLPSVNEIYPSGVDNAKHYDFGLLDKTMEGAYRPGHFAGVAQVVKRLLDIVLPDQLFMGLKDYQQFKIVGKLIDIEQMPVSIVGCPIIREPHGLAMSSRNVRLSTSERQQAAAINQALIKVCKNLHVEGNSVPILNVIKQNAIKYIEHNIEGAKVEYLSIVHADTLAGLEVWQPEIPTMVLTAVRVGEIRLLDNRRIDSSCA